MDYFIKHLPAIFVGALVVAALAGLWQYLTVRNAENRRKRFYGRKKDRR